MTGASSGVGLAIARRLVELGLRVYGFGGNYTETPYHDSHFIPVTCDLSNPLQIEEKIDWILEREGTVLALVNNAKRYLPKSLDESTPAELQSVLAINLLCPLVMAKQLLPGLRKTRGYIINISVNNPEHARGGPAGAAASGGLRWMSEVLFEEERDYGVKVSTIFPQPNRRRADMPQQSGNLPDHPNSQIDPDAIAQAVVDIISSKSGNLLAEVVIRPQRYIEKATPPAVTLPYPQPLKDLDQQPYGPSTAKALLAASAQARAEEEAEEKAALEEEYAERERERQARREEQRKREEALRQEREARRQEDLRRRKEAEERRKAEEAAREAQVDKAEEDALPTGPSSYRDIDEDEEDDGYREPLADGFEEDEDSEDFDSEEDESEFADEGPDDREEGADDPRYAEPENKPTRSSDEQPQTSGPPPSTERPRRDQQPQRQQPAQHPRNRDRERPQHPQQRGERRDFRDHRDQRFQRDHRSQQQPRGEHPAQRGGPHGQQQPARNYQDSQRQAEAERLRRLEQERLQRMEARRRADEERYWAERERHNKQPPQDPRKQFIPTPPRQERRVLPRGSVRRMAEAARPAPSQSSQAPTPAPQHKPAATTPSVTPKVEQKPTAPAPEKVNPDVKPKPEASAKKAASPAKKRPASRSKPKASAKESKASEAEKKPRAPRKPRATKAAKSPSQAKKPTEAKE